MPFDHFARLPDEKKREILNAALEEFVEYGYDLASTNRIVERAGIAKGALFKYFSTKESLFLFLCEQCAEEVSEAVAETIRPPYADFFETVKKMAYQEIVLSLEKPELFSIFQHMSKHPEHPVYKQALQRDHEKSRDMVWHLIQSLSRNSLRQGVSLERILLICTWVIDGLKQKIFMSNLTNQMEKEEWMKEIRQEVDWTIEVIKYGVLHS